MRVGIVLGSVVTIAGLGLAVGPPGILVGLVIGGLAWRVNGALAFALGQIIVAVFGVQSPAALGIAEIGLVGLLVSGEPSGLDLEVFGAVVIGMSVSLLGVRGGLAVFDGLWSVAGLAVAAVALIVYAIHRFELVFLWRSGIDTLTDPDTGTDSYRGGM